MPARRSRRICSAADPVGLSGVRMKCGPRNSALTGAGISEAFCSCSGRGIWYARWQKRVNFKFAARGFGERPDEHPRIPGQGGAEGIRRADLARRAGAEGGRCRSRREGAPRSGLGGEEPDPRRRPRQGQVQGSLRRRQGRRADRQVGRRGQRIRQADARRHAGHDPDRPAGQAGQPALRRGRLRHRQGVLSLDPGRPRDLARGVRRLHRRRRQHRGRRAQQPRKDRDLLGRSRHRHHGPSRPHGREGAGSVRRLSPSRRRSW